MNPSGDNRETGYRAGWAECPAWPSLDCDREAEVVLVGGGLAGLNTAASLVERGVGPVLVLEARSLAHGASGRNGGFVFAGYSLGPEALARQVGPDRARQMLAWTMEGVDRVRKRSSAWGIDCQIRAGGVIWADWFHDEQRLLERRAWLQENVGLDWTYIAAEKLAGMLATRRYGAGLLETGGFHYDPLRYAHGLAQGLLARDGAVFEDSPVTGLKRDADGWIVRTPSARVRARRVILCGGAYGPFPLARIRRSVLPIRSYAMTTEPLGARAGALIRGPWAVYDTRFAFDYYRLLPDTRLLWGGRISIREPSPDKLQSWLRRDMLKVFPQLHDVAIERCWSGRMSYSRHQMPILGELEPGLYSCTGFGGHGMAPTALAGEILAEAVTGTPDRLAAFARWQPVHAGGAVGMVAAQAFYWACQVADGFRTWRGSRSPGGRSG